MTTLRTKYLVKFTNTNVDAGNYQLCDVDLGTLGTYSPEEGAAQIIAYFATVSGTFGSGTRIAELSARPIGTPGFIPVPFPTTDYAAVVASGLTDGFIVPAMASGYGSSLGSGALAPLGTSVSVSELTAHPGKTGRGRHFLPFIGASNVTAGGALNATQALIILQAYTEFILGENLTGASATAPIKDLVPVVASSLAAPGWAITTVKAQTIFSNLESRRR